jgi:hypothetical protein
MLRGPFPAGGLQRAVSDGIVLSADSSQRDGALSLIAASGAGVVRIPLVWRSVVGGSPPPGFNARDPGDPAYNFAAVDASVRDAAAAGLVPLLVVGGAPAFAEAPGRWPYAYPGSWDPSPSDFEAFAAAVATRYDGAFPDPLHPGAALPAVRLFQAWNEPNLARYLEPQWIAVEGRWQPFAPAVYRRLLNGFYAGVKSIQPQATVVAAGVAPDGDPAGVGRMAPVTFLRELLCVSAAGRAIRAGCEEPAHLDVLAFHPLSVASPNAVARSSLDVAIADAGKVGTVLRSAQADGTALPSAPKPLWVTELNWDSAPQSPHGVAPARQAVWVSRALHRLWVSGVSLVSWEFLVDPFPLLRQGTPTGAIVSYPRPAGLYSAGPGGSIEGARPKPFLQGFELPFDPLRAGPRTVRVWALLSHPDEPALLERLHRQRWHVLAHLRASREGVVNAGVHLRGALVLRLLVAGRASALAKVPAR